MSKPCNRQLYKMWKRVIPLFPFPRLAIQVDQLLSFFCGKSYRNDEIKKKYESCDTGTIDKTAFLKKIEKPHLFFTEIEILTARKIMKQMGIDNEKKIICLVVRDSAYLNKQYPKTDWRYHDHRNADILSYKKAALYLANKGYYVLRMGKYVDKQFDVDHPRVIDYANHLLRSDFMDIYLPAHCVFCISTCTGLDCVSQIFRKPVLLTNISPAFGETLMWYPCYLLLPKRIKNIKTDAILTLSKTNQIFASFSSKEILAELAKRDLVLLDNNEDELLEAVIEMEARVNGTWQETDFQKEAQAVYWSVQKKHRPILVDDIYIKISAHFLQSNQMLCQ